MRYRTVVALALLPPAALSAAKPARIDRPAVFQKVIDCRAVTDPTQRLACFDASVAALATSEDSHDLMVVDRAQVDRTRQQLFGFSLPKLSIFGIGGKDDAQAPKQLEGVVQSAHRNKAGLWVLELADGGVWRQTDQTTVFSDPHAGSKVVIRRAALGTFFIRIDGQIGFRGERVS